MQATPVRIIQYFDGEKQSVIPLFQRTYTWTKKNWKTLWDDILTQHDLGGTGTHFMGAIVSIPATTVPVGVNKYLVIDGQQRLTTVALLLRALKDFTDHHNSGRIEDFLVNRHQAGTDRLKLLPTQGDREFYSRLILDANPPTDDHRMRDAYDWFRERIQGNGLDDTPLDADRLLQTVTQSLQVVMINLGDADDPYLIFESLNYKGEPLTQADLVRNYILMRFRSSLQPGGEQERVYRTIWKPLETSLGGNLTEFLRHYSMKEGDDIKQGGIYAAVKDRFSRCDDAEGIERELATLTKHGSFYRAFIDPATETSVPVRQKLQSLRSLETTTGYPLLLRLFDARAAGRLGEDQLLECLHLIESFVVRRFVCRVPTNALNKLFLQWSKTFPESDTLEWLRTSMAAGSGGRRWPGDAEFEAELHNQPQYERKATRHILLRLEEGFGHRERVDLSSATIEHVMPQQLSDAWRAALGEDYELVHRRLLHTLGNLTLTGYNAELSNLPFGEKKALLATSHIDLNRWICDQDAWTAESIRERGAMLVELTKRAFVGPPPGSVSAGSSGPIDGLFDVASDLEGDDGEGEISAASVKLLQKEYWTRFAELLTVRGSRIVPHTPQPHHWSTVSIGRRYFNLAALVNTVKDRIGVELYIRGSDAKRHFRRLEKQKAHIEKEMEGQLDWRELPDKSACRILLMKPSTSIKDRAAWSEQHKWLADTLERMDGVFRARVLALPTSYPPDVEGSA